jgi:hypothetical protein
MEFSLFLTSHVAAIYHHSMDQMWRWIFKIFARFNATPFFSPGMVTMIDEVGISGMKMSYF